MKIVRLVLLAAALAFLPSAVQAQGKPAPKDALLYFIWPQNGAVIKGGERDHLHRDAGAESDQRGGQVDVQQ